jgi:hypothetical protein
MNIIKKLRLENAIANEEAAILREGLMNLRDYASSDKFAGEGGFKDGHINRQDILLRVEEVDSGADQAYDRVKYNLETWYERDFIRYYGTHRVILLGNPKENSDGDAIQEVKFDDGSRSDVLLHLLDTVPKNSVWD